MKRLLIFILPALLGCVIPAQAGTGNANDASAVRQTVSGFAEAWNRHDMVASGRLFTRDADFVNEIRRHSCPFRARGRCDRSHGVASGRGRTNGNGADRYARIRRSSGRGEMAYRCGPEHGDSPDGAMN